MNTTSDLSGPGPKRRRQFLPVVDARFQWKYTLIITAMGAGIAAIAGGLLYKAQSENTRVLDINPRLQEQVIRNDQIFLLYLVVFVLCMGAFLAIMGLIMTHRISGPLFIVARHLDALAGGVYPDIRPLRRHDELQDFFASFEKAVNALRHRDIMNLKEVDMALTTRDDHDSALKALETIRSSLTGTLGNTDSVEVSSH